jgi:hypothetical protein
MADPDEPTELFETVMDLVRSSVAVDVAKSNTTAIYTGAIPGRPKIFFFIVCILMSIAGTILNFATIFTINSLPKPIRKDASHTFILSLSIADLLLSMIVIPAQLLQIVFRKVEIVGESLCAVSQLAFFWTFELSLFTLTVVSVNR